RGRGAHAHSPRLGPENLPSRGRARYLAAVSEAASARAVESTQFAGTLRRGRYVMKLNTLFALAAVTGATMACASGSATMSSQSASPTSASAATGEWVNLIDPKLTAWRGYKEQT